MYELENLIYENNLNLLKDQKLLDRGRNSYGRFTYGNRFSIGNKGGRPRKLSLSELENNLLIIDKLIVDSLEKGSTQALNTLFDLLDGKLK